MFPHTAIIFEPDRQRNGERLLDCPWRQARCGWDFYLSVSAASLDHFTMKPALFREAP
jgi:hypothetical protein